VCSSDLTPPKFNQPTNKTEQIGRFQFDKKNLPAVFQQTLNNQFNADGYNLYQGPTLSEAKRYFKPIIRKLLEKLYPKWFLVPGTKIWLFEIVEKPVAPEGDDDELDSDFTPTACTVKMRIGDWNEYSAGTALGCSFHYQYIGDGVHADVSEVRFQPPLKKSKKIQGIKTKIE
jgi:hypothetical protein